MSLPTLGITLNLYDGTGAPLTTGSAVFTTTGPVTVNNGLQEITPAPVTQPMTGGLQTAAIIPTDIAGSSPSGWGWEVAFPGVPGDLEAFTFLCPAGPVTFTAAAGTPGVVTWTPTAALTSLPPGTGVQFASGAPAGAANATTYYIASSTSSTCQVSATLGGAPLAFTGTGSGQLAVVSYLLSGLAPVASSLSLSRFMPVPSGTPAAGQVPVATGTGEQSAWAAPASGSGGLPALAETAVTASGTLALNTVTTVTATSGVAAMTLPSPVADSLIVVERETASTQNVTVTGNIRGVGSTTITLQLGSESEMFFSTGSSWWPVAGHKTLSSLQALFPPMPAGTPAPGQVPAVTTTSPLALGWTTPSSVVVSPSTDATGVTDLANINAALTGFPRKKAFLAAGTFYISGPITPQANTRLEGSGCQTTTIMQGSSFAGACMYQAANAATITNLNLAAPSTTTTANVQADAILITQVSGGLIANVTVQNIFFTNINGLCVNFTDTGTGGDPTGCFFDNLRDGGHNSGGIAFYGASRSLGAWINNVSMNANGGTVTTYDAFYMTDVFDLEMQNFFYGVGGTSTGSAMHLAGHCSNGRFLHSEIGSGANCLKIEDGTNGHAVNLTFADITFQTATAADVDLEGTCTDIQFDDCQFNAAGTHGVTVNTTGNHVKFRGCGFGVSAGNGAGHAGTNYDLNWTGTGTGSVDDTEFSSSVVSVGGSGVQKTVNITAGQQVIFSAVKFTGASSTSANWFTGIPSGVMECSSGAFNFFAGIKPVTSAWGPADQGLAAWTFDGAPMASQGFQLATAGTGYATAFMIRQTTTISEFFALVQTAGATLTSGQCFGAVYNSAGVLLGSTADQGTNWQSTGLNGAAAAGVALTVASGQSLTLPPGKYFAAVFYNGTTAPKFLAGTGNPVFLVANTGQTGVSARCATLFTGATTTVPTSCTYTAGGSAIWFAVS